MQSLIDPPRIRMADSVLVRAPEKDEPGYWAGCPSVRHDGNRFLLTYRERHPRGVEPERGWRCAVAESTDGVEFRDLWEVHKDELASPSMERMSLVRQVPDGDWLAYLSYVDPADNRWRIDVLRAGDPAGFDIARRTEVFTAASTGTEGIKDPYTLVVGGSVLMYAVVSRSREFTAAERDLAHATADIHNTGLTTQPTVAAISQDGTRFDLLGEVLPTGNGWDAYESRLTCVVPTGDGYLGLYDGSASYHENYEERCGVAVSTDLTRWLKTTPTGPRYTSPHGTGSLRYVDVAVVGDEWFVYFEATRADGAHELRLARVPRP